MKIVLLDGGDRQSAYCKGHVDLREFAEGVMVAAEWPKDCLEDAPRAAFVKMRASIIAHSWHTVGRCNPAQPDDEVTFWFISDVKPQRGAFRCTYWDGGL